LLHAAFSSPTARQASASCAALLAASWASPPAGSRIATADDLAPLVEALRAAYPEMAMVEDFVPLDPRRRVHFRAASGGRSWEFRVHPGALESPLQVLQAVVNYAEALDPVLLPRFGHGVADMLEVAGRMLDVELAILVPAWDCQEVALDSVPAVTGAEVAAAASYLDKWGSGGVLLAELAEFRDDDGAGRLAGAARGLIVNFEDLSFDAGPDRSHVGPALFVRGPAGVLPVPSGLIIQSLTAAVTAASRFVSARGEAPREGPESGEPSRDPETDIPRVTAGELADVARRWRDRADSDLAWACRSLPATILFGRLADGGHELLLLTPGHRHVVAVDLVTGLNFEEINASIQAARERLAKVGPGSRFRVSPPRDHRERLGDVPGASAPPPGTTDSGITWPAGTADAIPFPESLLTGEAAALAAGTVVTRIVVVDGPWQHGPTWVPEIPACTLDEFRSLLAAQDWQSTDREELWSFLDELTSLGADSAGTGWAKLICWSILDAWEAWQANGMLCPAWIDPGICAGVPPRDLDDAWERDAFLDDVDAMLARLGMGGVREWSQLIPTPVAALPDGGERSFVVTLSLYVPRRISWIATDMGLLVSADLEFRAGLTFSRAAVGTLANVIEDTLREMARQNPPAWQQWREAHGDHPVAIHVTPGLLPEGMPALRFIGMGEIFDQLYVDPSRLAQLPDDDVHALIGEALTFAMLARLQSARPGDKPASSLGQDTSDTDVQEHATEPGGGAGGGRVIELNPTNGDLERAETFRAAWQGIPPRLTQRARTGPFRPYELTAALTLTENGHDRAERTIARRLRTRLSPGVHPLQAVLSELCPGALEALSDAARGYAPRAALAAACAELERALSDRFASRTSLEVNLGSSWAEETFAELDITASSDETRRSRIAELLTERLLSQPPAGSLVPDRRDVHNCSTSRRPPSMRHWRPSMRTPRYSRPSWKSATSATST
jgi:hypothetical protein